MAKAVAEVLGAGIEHPAGRLPVAETAPVALPGDVERGLPALGVAAFLVVFLAVQVAWLGALGYLVWLAWHAV